jgi:hypothetical protein
VSFVSGRRKPQKTGVEEKGTRVFGFARRDMSVDPISGLVFSAMSAKQWRVV